MRLPEIRSGPRVRDSVSEDPITTIVIGSINLLVFAAERFGLLRWRQEGGVGMAGKNRKERLDEIFPDLICCRRWFHENPELSGEEVATSRFIYEKLAGAGIDAKIMENGSGVTAVIHGAGAGGNILCRSDMDALPMSEKSGLSFSSRVDSATHACGHDLHMTVMLGTALILNECRGEFSGSARFIFQGGEETFSGARAMIAAGALKNPKPDCALALHAWPDLRSGTIGLKKGAMMASSSSVSFTIKGKGGHAAHPHKAIDPVMIAAYILTSLQTIASRNVSPLDSSVITFGRIAAGSAANIIPDMARAEGTVRTLSAETDKFIEKRLKNLIRLQAESFGAEAEFSYERVCPPVINAPDLVGVLANSARRSIGEENIKWLDVPSMGSEDFSLYLEKIPGALVRLGTANDLEQSRLPLHNPGIIFEEESMRTGVVFMLGAIFEILSSNT